ncbi:flagellar hook-associated protein 1 FlgK [Bacillus oleivorans]|uniref:Flagellar hook-associated protein 1 n=1 Tax=Bacillus oleivorans TaxID=1448271 RepID=A0A285CZD7_9BACI|nr:flagellar hook-associated protein FlgK [Bacillus oleivorans]SNX72924.1 flagellar hook-associated protein 1 FlgK [Bacillus oleivorans]
MPSTFHGLETAKRAMFTQQSALYTTGHNVANANTPGYSRQRVEFTQTEPYPSAAMNRPDYPGQLGSGVKAGSIQRIRESFLDVQYRGENSKVGYWGTKADALQKMEEILNEPSESGLSHTIDQFWQSLQDLAVNPTNAGARSVVRQRGIALAETFNYLSDSLNGIKTDLKTEIGIAKDKVNSLLDQISQVNAQIASVEPHGYLPNDLYDKRDLLIDELSSMVKINVDYVESGGDPAPGAMGQAVVKLANEAGGDMAVLVGPAGYNEIDITFGGPNGSVDFVKVGGKQIAFTDFDSQGQLKGLIEGFGYQDAAGLEAGTFPKMLAELDNLAFTFATEFNKVHAAGMGPNEIAAKTNSNINFFADNVDVNGAITSRDGFASRIGISQEILDSLDNIANAVQTNPGAPDGQAEADLGDMTNVLNLADVFNVDFDYGLNNEKASLRTYYESVIGDMAVESQEATRLSQNSGVLRQAVEERRMSASSVSLDEEMTNMIKFQHAYNAAARMITLTDEMLDKIINGMGTGGR